MKLTTTITFSPHSLFPMTVIELHVGGNELKGSQNETGTEGGRGRERKRRIGGKM